MIAALTGTVSVAGEGMAVIDVNGVGYRVFCSRRTLDRLPRGEAASVLVEMRVRDDHIHLYGFADEAERGWYRLLSQVQGVGGRTALALLSVASPEQLAAAIAVGDRATLTAADGVGPKLAARILTELKDKVGGIATEPTLHSGAGPAQPAAAGAEAEALSALVNLGYGRAEAFTAVTRAAAELKDGATVERLIPAALKALSS